MIFSRLIRLISTLFFIGLPLAFSATAPDWDRSDEGEARRLLERAEDYVRNINEGDFSYNYLQFYWKRAQSNFDRILRAYPNTEVARAIQSGQTKIGPFDTTYFKERVLPRVEVKKLGAYDAVNCAIFLYNLDQQRWDANRLLAQQKIIEVLARQQRWNEALIFPVRDQEADAKKLTVYRVAAHFNQPKISALLREKASPALLQAFDELDAEGIIYLGLEREKLDDLLAKNASTSLRETILRATVTRELLILNPPEKLTGNTKGIGRTHFSILNLAVRDDVRALAAKLFPAGSRSVDVQLARLAAGQGTKPDADLGLEPQEAYLEWLVRQFKLADAERYVASAPSGTRKQLHLLHARALAEAGEADASAKVLAALALEGGERDRAELIRFNGTMESLVQRLHVQPETFSTLQIQDPCLLASAIMDWSLTPNRQLRGAAPWDAVVFKFLPGFENLPLPESDEVGKAASLLKPY